ncbi:TIGR02921 family PEP-CTERM protein [candidate division CSSED10-310 bacterium]|uniref:TIGR02921 family PEP-CTERM protein n=1 Tax=candidate division CSSED10-310 bacterium TaxID=2855610 RepID=A0ABV6YTQ2_UNCC1
MKTSLWSDTLHLLWGYRSKIKNICIYGIFWFWNALFLLMTIFILIPAELIPQFYAVMEDDFPLEFFTMGCALILTVVVYTITGMLRSFRSEPDKLFVLFYGIEVPLVLLFVLRLFLVREVTAGTGHILLLIFSGIICYVVLFQGKQWAEQSLPSSLKLVCAFCIGIIGFGFGLFFLFHAIPIGAALVHYFFSFNWVQDILWIFNRNRFATIFTHGLMALFGICSATLFLIFPIAFITLYTMKSGQIFRSTWFEMRKSVWFLIIVGLVLLNIFLAYHFDKQPQVTAFQLLENTPQTDQERLALLDQAPVIRAGLVNAYLSPYRYLSPIKDSNHIQYMYGDVFNLEKGASHFVQGLFNLLVKPFLYQGDRFRTAQEVARAQYEAFFDVALQRAEQSTLKHALESTWNRDQALAGLLNIEDRAVYLAEQQIDLKEFGSWATIEIQETYLNRTYDQQEIFYSFSLPDCAVLTGIWLGETPDRESRFRFTVASRGAAQKVYKREVRRRQDPALLEQVGPRQFRLRVFPIPANQYKPKKQGVMYLWLTYATLRSRNGTWPLPRLLEKRNIYWDSDSEREYLPYSHEREAWLPRFLPARTHLKQQASFKVKVTDHAGIRFEPKIGNYAATTMPEQRLAILIDRSRSMEQVRTSLHRAVQQIKQIDWIKPHFFLSGYDFDFLADPEKIEFDHLLNFGSYTVMDMLEQMLAEIDLKNYDAVLVLTDLGSYELAKDHRSSLPMDIPLWLVHLNRQLPAAYPDYLLETIQMTSGGVATSLPEFSQQQNLRLLKKEDPARVAVSPQFIISVCHETSQDFPERAQTGLTAIAARYLVQHYIEKNQMEILSNREQVHAIAQNYAIVSPYSSMIVLVNERQQQELAKAEQEADRFERTIESGNESLTAPSNPFGVSAVPEPEEWVLIIVVSFFLFYSVITRRKSTLIM